MDARSRTHGSEDSIAARLNPTYDRDDRSARHVGRIRDGPGVVDEFTIIRRVEIIVVGEIDGDGVAGQLSCSDQHSRPMTVGVGREEPDPIRNGGCPSCADDPETRK